MSFQKWSRNSIALQNLIKNNEIVISRKDLPQTEKNTRRGNYFLAACLEIAERYPAELKEYLRTEKKKGNHGNNNNDNSDLSDVCGKTLEKHREVKERKISDSESKNPDDYKWEIIRIIKKEGKHEDGGLIGPGVSLLENFFNWSNILCLHSVFHDASGYMRTKFKVGRGYTYISPWSTSECQYRGQVTGLLYCIGLMIFCGKQFAKLNFKEDKNP